MQNLQIINHPLIQESLTFLRSRETTLEEFRSHSDRISQLLFAEPTRGLEIADIEVETPLAKTKGFKCASEIIVIPVLRAGVAMLFGAMQLLPKSKIGFVGLERDENTAIASQYYWKLPVITNESVVFVADPMLATGGSLIHVLRQVAPKKPKSISIICVIAAPEGVKAIEQKFSDVKIYTAVLDERLNDKKYIVPGLGDYGDRYFGT